MAGFTNFAYRQMVRELGGAGLLATEMISARSFAWINQQQADPPERLWGVMEESRPLAVQVWDNDPATLAKVGAVLAHEYRVSLVDINFGCPVRQIVQRAQSGSYLLKYPDRMGAIIERVARACSPVPVTAKIRLGCTQDRANAIDVAQVVEGAGAAALTVHGRTADQMFRGQADWDRISALKAYLKRIPLIGNGDLDSPQKVADAFRRYLVDGVMIARSALAKPWLFHQAAALLRGEPVPPDPSLLEQRHLLEHHYRLVCEQFGTDKGTMLMRKYACRYARGQAGAGEFRKHAAKAKSPDEFRDIVARLFPVN